MPFYHHSGLVSSSIQSLCLTDECTLWVWQLWCGTSQRGVGMAITENWFKDFVQTFSLDNYSNITCSAGAGPGLALLLLCLVYLVYCSSCSSLSRDSSNSSLSSMWGDTGVRLDSISSSLSSNSPYGRDDLEHIYWLKFSTKEKHDEFTW